MPRRRPLVIGHRGAPGYRPEHSPSAYDLALAMGADAVEPDVVVSRDGVLVVRHENEISGTTDVSERPEFADRRTTKRVDGAEQTGWFTEDFTWEELSTLRVRERIPALRATSATYDDRQPMLRLRDVLDLVRRASLEQGREIGAVVEIKHATYFAGIGLDHVPLLLAELEACGWGGGAHPLVIESFEQSVITRLQREGLPATYVYLLEAAGTAYDLRASRQAGVPSYADQLSPRGLDVLASQVDGISLDKKSILRPDRMGRSRGPAPVVAEAHQRGLQVFTWTARPENAFLLKQFRTGAKAEFGDYEAEWQILRDAQVDGVFVDHPDLGVDFFRTPAVRD
ncbi:MAG: glycerophosphodiester phosphodiesterase [Microbacterium sp.]|nr:glycerophosphodiester phosphodiesterase [Microbacterium sp.]